MNYSYLDCLAMLGVGGAHPGGLKLTKELLAHEKLDVSTSVLDAGCGTGQTAAYIAKEYGCHVTALDNNEIMVEKANDRFLTEKLQIKAVEGSVEDLPFAEASFDIVLSESVMLFTDVARSIPEFKRVLKPNGKLLAIEMVMEKEMNDKELGVLKAFYEDAIFRSEGAWRQAFNHAGFQDVQVEKTEVRFDPEDVDSVPDFSLTELMDPAYFDIMKEHEEMIESYKNILGFRIFKCIK
ncbi:class I SAM-dependent methyltransferase [Virgibacillus oceani]